MLRELLRRPALKQLLQEEVDAALQGGRIDMEILDGMESLRDFIREVLRLYPPAYALRRTASRDFEFQGYAVRKGQSVVLFTTACHTDPAYFPDPYSFDLERYREPRLEHRALGAYSPFGKGPHVCIGAGLANLLMPLNLALILRHTEMRENGIRAARPGCAGQLRQPSCGSRTSTGRPAPCPG